MPQPTEITQFIFGQPLSSARASSIRPRCANATTFPERPTPERCVEAYYLQRTRFESIAQRKLRRRQLLTEDGNVEIGGRSMPKADVHRGS